VGIDPASPDTWNLGNQADMDLLVRPHGNPGFLHGNWNPSFIIDLLLENHRRRHTAEIHGGAGPIEYDGAKRAAASPGVGKFSFMGELHSLIIVLA
jgi:hypothetical protein